MARGDIIARLVKKLGGTPHPDRDKPGGCHFRLWGGEVKLYGSHDGKRHWFHKGPDLFVVRRNFAELLAAVIDLGGLGHMGSPRLRLSLSFGRSSPIRERLAADGFWVGFYYPEGGHVFPYFGTDEYPEAWQLALGFLAHGEWRPLVDHLLETDPEFADKWAAFEAARAQERP